MLRAMIAGLLSMTALVPPALAQDGRSMDRGQWRRERAERPVLPPAARPAPAPETARPPEPGPPRGTREGAPARGEPGGSAGNWAGGLGRADRRPDETRRRPAPNGDWRSERPPEPRDDRRVDGLPRPPAPTGEWRSDRGDWRSARAPQERRDDWREPARPPRDGGWSADPGRRGYVRRDAPRPPATVWRADSLRQWDRSWRREPQYDWNRYRNERRSVFRLPRYYAPYGWDSGYRRFGVGIAIAPMLYTPRYWIYDPYAYRLPDAEEPYRWVRYYDDALLVDIEDGTVVDVIHGIFE